MATYKNIDDKATLAELASYYLDNVIKGHYAEATYKSYKSKLDKYVIPGIGNIQVTQLKKLDILNLVYGLDNEAQSLSPNSIRIVYGVLRKVLNFAVDIELSSKNVSDNIKLPAQVKFIPKTYSKVSIKILLDKSKNHFLYVPINLAVKIGLRRSEILALRWKDFDPDNGTLMVSKAINKGKQTLDKSKNKRFLKIPSQLVALLETHKKEQRKRLLKNGLTQTGNTLVVCKDNGKPYNQTFVSRKFSELLSSNNLSPIRFHDLRHSYASHAHNDGMPVKHLSKSLGHVSAVTTLDNYVHISDEYSI